jgi:hypothetical protein
MTSGKHQPGTVFIFSPNCLKIDKEADPCYATTGVNALVYRNVSLLNYPSAYDFFEPVSEIKKGAIGIIVRPLGVPHSFWLRPEIINDPELREKYTVYEAFICKELVQVFSNDISLNIVDAAQD